MAIIVLFSFYLKYLFIYYIIYIQTTTRSGVCIVKDIYLVYM